MDDLIRRQDAIDTILADKIVGSALLIMKAIGESDTALTLNSACDRHIQEIEKLPSAQPNLQPTCNNLATDAISRQAAIDAVRRCSVKEVAPAYMLIDKAEVMTELMMLPSAEPEVIHCKDCKNADHDAIFDDLWCDGREVSADHYCGLAERKCDGR